MDRQRVAAGMMSVLLLASGCASAAQDSEAGSSSTGESAERETSPAMTSGAPKTDRTTASATPEDDTASPTSKSGAPTTSESSEPPEATTPPATCNADTIADVLGRDDVIVENCLDKWAYVYSDMPGDTGAFVRWVDGRWTDYDRQPSTRCRPEAKDDGVPDPLLKYFRGCSTSSPESDLGLSTEITQPTCDGSGIVVLGAATTPGTYRADVEDLLQRHPGSGYLRTDETCPSLSQATDAGEAIYAVYQPAGNSRQSICAAVRNAGGDAYGKRLDETSDPESVVDC